MSPSVESFAAYDAGNNLVFGSGSFTTGGGGGSSGSGTNATTTFVAGKLNYWNKSSASAPVPDPTIPYYFSATTALSSNRNANTITLTLPTSAVSNLTQTIVHPESWYFFSYTTSSNGFESTFPQGTYTFYVSATASNQSVRSCCPPR